MAEFTERVKLLIETVTEGATGGLSKLKSDVAEAEGGFNKLKTGASGAFSAIGGSASLLGGAVGGAIAGFVAKGVEEFTSLALAAKNFSTAAGISIEDASRWIKVSGDLGVSADTVQAAMGRMNREAAAGKLDKFGLQATDANGRFIEMLQKIAAIPDATQQAQAAFQVFGRSWQSLSPLLANLDTLKGRLDEVSGSEIITEAQAESARKFQDDIKNLQHDFEDLALTIGKDVLPVLDQLAKAAEKPIKFGGGAFDWATNLEHAIETPMKLLSHGLPDSVRNAIAGIPILSATVDGATDSLNKNSAALDFNTVAAVGMADAAAAAAVDVSHQITIEQARAVTLDATTIAAEGAAAGAAALAKQTAEAKKAAEEHKKVLEQQQKVLDQQKKDLADLRTKIEDVNAAWREGDEAAKAFTTGFAAVVGAADDVASAQEGVFDANQKLLDSWKKNGTESGIWTEKQRANFDATKNLAKAIGDDLAATLQSAGGNYETVTKKAELYRHNIEVEGKAAGLTKKQIAEYIQTLGLTPAQVETAIKLSGAEEARTKIGLLQVDINKLPPDKQTEYRAAINAGDYQQALKVLNEATVDPKTGKPREAPIKPFVPPKDALDASDNLDALQVDPKTGKPREATVYARANTVQGQNDIDQFVIRNNGRTVTIDVTTAGKIADFVHGGGFAGHLMAGGPVNEAGFYDVGEAGPERVFLPAGANVMSAGQLMTAGAGGGTTHIINVNVRVDPTVSLAQAGHKIADALEAYYRSNGSRRAYAPSF